MDVTTRRRRATEDDQTRPRDPDAGDSRTVDSRRETRRVEPSPGWCDPRSRAASSRSKLRDKPTPRHVSSARDEAATPWTSRRDDVARPRTTKRDPATGRPTRLSRDNDDHRRARGRYGSTRTRHRLAGTTASTQRRDQRHGTHDPRFRNDRRASRRAPRTAADTSTDTRRRRQATRAEDDGATRNAARRTPQATGERQRNGRDRERRTTVQGRNRDHRSPQLAERQDATITPRGTASTGTRP